MVWRGAACGLLLVATAADLVFRVPEVVVQHAAASRPVGTGRSNASGAGGAGAGRAGARAAAAGAGALDVQYEEYYVEHEVSTAAARAAAKALDLNARYILPLTLINLQLAQKSVGGGGVRRVQPARAGVLRDAAGCGPLLLRAALPARAVPLGAAHVLPRPPRLPPARARLRALRAPARLLLLQRACAQVESHLVFFSSHHGHGGGASSLSAGGLGERVNCNWLIL